MSKRRALRFNPQSNREDEAWLSNLQYRAIYPDLLHPKILSLSLPREAEALEQIASDRDATQYLVNQLAYGILHSYQRIANRISSEHNARAIYDAALLKVLKLVDILDQQPGYIALPELLSDIPYGEALTANAHEISEQLPKLIAEARVTEEVLLERLRESNTQRIDLWQELQDKTQRATELNRIRSRSGDTGDLQRQLEETQEAIEDTQDRLKNLPETKLQNLLPNENLTLTELLRSTLQSMAQIGLADFFYGWHSSSAQSLSEGIDLLDVEKLPQRHHSLLKHYVQGSLSFLAETVVENALTASEGKSTYARIDDIIHALADAGLIMPLPERLSANKVDKQALAYNDIRFSSPESRYEIYQRNYNHRLDNAFTNQLYTLLVPGADAKSTAQHIVAQLQDNNTLIGAEVLATAKQRNDYRDAVNNAANYSEFVLMQYTQFNLHIPHSNYLYLLWAREELLADPINDGLANEIDLVLERAFSNWKSKYPNSFSYAPLEISSFLNLLKTCELNNIPPPEVASNPLARPLPAVAQKLRSKNFMGPDFPPTGDSPGFALYASPQLNALNDISAGILRIRNSGEKDLSKLINKGEGEGNNYAEVRDAMRLALVFCVEEPPGLRDRADCYQRAYFSYLQARPNATEADATRYAAMVAQTYDSRAPLREQITAIDLQRVPQIVSDIKEGRDYVLSKTDIATRATPSFSFQMKSRSIGGRTRQVNEVQIRLSTSQYLETLIHDIYNVWSKLYDDQNDTYKLEPQNDLWRKDLKKRVTKMTDGLLEHGLQIPPAFAQLTSDNSLQNETSLRRLAHICIDLEKAFNWDALMNAKPWVRQAMADLLENKVPPVVIQILRSDEKVTFGELQGKNTDAILMQIMGSTHARTTDVDSARTD